MDASASAFTRVGRCELWFQSLFGPGRGFCFPCDAAGHVDLDAMTERQRNSYFYARAVVGRDLMPPRVQASLH